jgi:hypothetical protein
MFSAGATGGIGQYSVIDADPASGIRAAALSVLDVFGLRIADVAADQRASERAFGVQIDKFDGSANGVQWPFYYGDFTQVHPTVLHNTDGQDTGAWTGSGVTGAWTDNTTEAATAGGTAFTLLADDNDASYFGTTSPTTFRRMLLVLNLPATAAALTLIWEYWNGAAWTALTVTDDSAALNRRGSSISFVPPSDWATLSQNGLTRFWVRLRNNPANPKTGNTPTCYMVIVDTDDHTPLAALDPAGQFHNFKYECDPFTAANGANNDIDIGGAGFVRITGPTGAFNLTGFAGGADGRRLIVYNTTAQTMTLTHQATSGATNQITSVTGADEAVAGPCIAEFIYDATATKWILLSTKT